jgi:hypothetical protein
MNRKVNYQLINFWGITSEQQPHLEITREHMESYVEHPINMAPNPL